MSSPVLNGHSGKKTLVYGHLVSNSAIYFPYHNYVNLTMSDEQVPVAGAVQAAQAILQPVPPPEPGPAAAGPANPEPLQIKFFSIWQAF